MSILFVRHHKLFHPPPQTILCGFVFHDELTVSPFLSFLHRVHSLFTSVPLVVVSSPPTCPDAFDYSIGFLLGLSLVYWSQLFDSPVKTAVPPCPFLFDILTMSGGLPIFKRRTVSPTPPKAPPHSSALFFFLFKLTTFVVGFLFAKRLGPQGHDRSIFFATSSIVLDYILRLRGWYRDFSMVFLTVPILNAVQIGSFFCQCVR